MVISKETYNQWVNDPYQLTEKDLEPLNELIETFPYCQTTRLLKTICLQNIGSFQFNQHLKQTAAYSGDRRRLFDLVTKKTKIKNKLTAIKEKIKPVEDSKIKQKEDILNIGEPLEFNKSETYSFSEWLKLTKAKPIQRKEEKNTLQEKVGRIEKYIANRDRKPHKTTFFSASDKSKESETFEFSIVTETLAKVYLEQGHYERAKEAYRQLSLKYPQKSSLFASRIELIDQLIKNK